MSPPPYPNPDCRHPERYTARDIRATENEVIDLLYGFLRALQPDRVLETGTYYGDASRRMGEALQQNGVGHLDTLDISPDRIKEARANVAGLPATVHHIDSLHFTPPGPLGFLWLDSHPLLREAEFRHYRPFMLPGCIVGFHDTSVRHKVTPQIERLEGEGLLKAIYLPTWRGVAFAEVS